MLMGKIHICLDIESRLVILKKSQRIESGPFISSLARGVNMPRNTWRSSNLKSTMNGFRRFTKPKQDMRLGKKIVEATPEDISSF